MTVAMHLNGPSLNMPAELRGCDETSELPCCMGAAVYGVNRCTCWQPIFDLEQQPLGAQTEPVTRAKCCEDCAYRNGSPERSDDYEEDELLAIAHDDAREFWCHQGVRRVVAFQHPDGRALLAGDGDYRPPIGPAERPVVWRADGTVGERCAGWAAHRGVI